MPVGTDDGRVFKDGFDYQADTVSPNSFGAAALSLNLNQQEQDLYKRHLTNLYGTGGVDNADGSRSSLVQTSIDHNNKIYNIPTVYGGKILPLKEAVDKAFEQGIDAFPSYDTVDQAENRYQAMHRYMEQDTGKFLANRQTNPLLTPKTVTSPSDTAVGVANMFVQDVKNTVANVINLVKLPKQAMVQGITTSEAIPWAINVAQFVASTSVPFAQEGAAGIFGGKLGSVGTPRFVELARAQRLETSGLSPKDIWQQTGWYKNPKDGQWRFEISDYNAELNFQNLGVKGLSDKFNVYIPKDAGLTVKDILSHKDLYQAYPDLSDVRVYPVPEKYEGQFLGYQGMYENQPFIAMHPQSPESFKAVLLHELQHIVQRKEGFTTGGNPLTALSDKLPELKEEYQGIRKQYVKLLEHEQGLTEDDVSQVANIVVQPESKISPSQREMIAQLKKRDLYHYFEYIGRGDRLVKQAEDISNSKYKRIVGEVEARNVEDRMNFSEERRRNLSPMDTQEFPFEEQIIPGGQGTSANMSVPRKFKVYHGSRNTFTEFDEGKLGSNTGAPSSKEGFFFTDRRKTAEYYAGLDNTNKKTLQNQERIKQTYLDLADEAEKQGNTERASYWRNAATNMKGFPSVREAEIQLQNPFVYDFKGKVFRDSSYKEIIRNAKEKGYDGVILKNTFDAGEKNKLDAYLRGRLKPETIYVVFDKKNIK